MTLQIYKFDIRILYLEGVVEGAGILDFERGTETFLTGSSRTPRNSSPRTLSAIPSPPPITISSSSSSEIYNKV